jgi:hypothetical protein
VIFCPKSILYRMSFIFLLFPLSIIGCRPKEYSSVYNIGGGNLLLRYDPAGKNVVVQAEPREGESYARLKFSPPQNRLKSFASKESTVRGCAARTNLGFAVSLTRKEWLSMLVLKWTRDENSKISPRTWTFSLRSEIDNNDADMNVEVVLDQLPDKWTIVIRNPLELTSHKLRNKFMALVVIDRSGLSENVEEWNKDQLSQIAQDILDARNAMMNCILSVAR